MSAAEIRKLADLVMQSSAPWEAVGALRVLADMLDALDGIAPARAALAKVQS